MKQVFELHINGKFSQYLMKSEVRLIKWEKEFRFGYLHLKSLIKVKKGDKTGAIETAKQSLAGAEKAKNADYVKMNKDSIAEWSKK